MPPGLVIQHARLPERSRDTVRGDLTAIVSFIKQRQWPAEAAAGDLVEVVLRSEADLAHHPDKRRFDPASRRAVRNFFRNGGDTCHVFGVCIASEEDVTSPDGDLGALAPLLSRLREEEELGILLAPGAAYLPIHMDRSGTLTSDAEPLYDLLLAHCRQMNNRFLILDAPKGLHGEYLVRWVEGFRERSVESRAYGAVYYPWLLDGDELFPPSGVLAGSFAGLELAQPPVGIARPPANVPLQGVTHTEVGLSFAEAGTLVESHINPIVVQTGRGVVAFGARTLSSVPRWKHINSRRVVNLVLEQLRRDCEWAVFETNNPHLWDVLERDTMFRLDQFAGAGLLSGSRAGEDYTVQCDRETNLPALRDAGEVNVRLRMKPVGTVEQIVVDLRIGAPGVPGGN